MPDKELMLEQISDYDWAILNDIENIFREFKIIAYLDYSDKCSFRYTLCWSEYYSLSLVKIVSQSFYVKEILKKDKLLNIRPFYGNVLLEFPKSSIDEVNLTTIYNIAENFHGYIKNFKK